MQATYNARPNISLQLLASLCVAMIVNTSWASSLDDLVERFLQANQEIAVEYFAENIENNLNALNCVKYNKHCASIAIEAGTDDHPLELEVNKASLLETIDTQYAGYRLVTGLANYNKIKSGLRRGRGTYFTRPLPGISRIVFETKTKKGRQEWETIQSIYKSEISGINEHNIWLNEHSLTDEKVSSSHLSDHFKLKLATLIDKFPFFAYLQKANPSEKELASAMGKMTRKYSKTKRQVASLEGDDRYEIFGFIDVFKRALGEFTDEEVFELQSHFQQLEEENTFWSKVWAVVSNKYTLFMFGCFTASAILTPTGIGPIIALVCGAIGATMSAKGISQVLIRTKRMMNYLMTGQYEKDVFDQYMVNNAIALTMYTVWARAAIPSLKRNLVNFKQNIAAAMVIRHLNGRFVKVDRQSLSTAFIEEAQLIWRYTWFYGREMGLEASTDNLTRFAGQAGSMIPAVASTFLASAEYTRKRQPAIFYFSDLLKLSRDWTDIR